MPAVMPAYFACVAALLTLVGYSVNEIIVNFARIREVRGKNPLLTPDMINTSVNNTLSRTILTSTTVWLVVMVLYAFGGTRHHCPRHFVHPCGLG